MLKSNLMTMVGALLVRQAPTRSAAYTKFSAMQRPDIKPVWFPWTSSGIRGFSLFVSTSATALIGQFWREIGRLAPRCLDGPVWVVESNGLYLSILFGLGGFGSWP